VLMCYFVEQLRTRPSTSGVNAFVSVYIYRRRHFAHSWRCCSFRTLQFFLVLFSLYGFVIVAVSRKHRHCHASSYDISFICMP